MDWKLVILDWDGTLVDSLASSYRIVQAICERYQAHAPSLEAYLSIANTTSERFLKMYRQAGIPDSVSGQELDRLWGVLSLETLDTLRLREGAQAMLERCRALAIPVAIVTLNQRAVIASGLDRLGIAHLVDHVTADAKGKVRELSATVARFGVRARQALYVDDTWEGITAARQAGITTIGIEGGFASRARLLEATPDYCVRSHDDVGRILFERAA